MSAEEIERIIGAIADPRFLTAVFFLVAVIIALVLLALKRSGDLAIKILGSLLVLGLSFRADNPFVYGVAIFVIATLVTALDFLEKLAAIAWGRAEYWDYRLRAASSHEVEAKREAEAEEVAQQEEQVPSPPAAVVEQAPPPALRTRTGILRQAVEFEHAVLRALREGKGPFQSSNVAGELSVDGGFGLSVYDAIVKAMDIHYLVEVKMYSRPSGLPNAVHEVQRLARTYRELLRSKNERVRVVPVVVVPISLNAPSLFQGIPILKFDPETRSFTNEEPVRKILEALRNQAV